MKEKAIIVFKIPKRNFEVDLEIPLDISAKELVTALNQAYDLGIDVTDVKECYLKAEAPIVFLKGNKLLKDYGVQNGTRISFTE